MATPPLDNYHQRGIETYLNRRILSLPSSRKLPAKEDSLQKLFSTFPGEWPGVGLLLVRALVACSLIAHGLAYVQTPNPSLSACCLAAVTFTAGAFLLAGLMTPFVAVFVSAVGIGLALSWIPLPGQALFDSHMGIINLIVLSIAIALLGPGAFSLDARMFGRREITIPRSR